MNFLYQGRVLVRVSPKYQKQPRDHGETELRAYWISSAILVLRLFDEPPKYIRLPLLHYEFPVNSHVMWRVLPTKQKKTTKTWIEIFVNGATRDNENYFLTNHIWWRKERHSFWNEVSIFLDLGQESQKSLDTKKNNYVKQSLLDRQICAICLYTFFLKRVTADLYRIAGYLIFCNLKKKTRQTVNGRRLTFSQASWEYARNSSHAPSGFYKNRQNFP